MKRSISGKLIFDFEIFAIASVLLCNMIRRWKGNIEDLLHDGIREVSGELVGVFIGHVGNAGGQLHMVFTFVP